VVLPRICAIGWRTWVFVQHFQGHCRKARLTRPHYFLVILSPSSLWSMTPMIFRSFNTSAKDLDHVPRLVVLAFLLAGCAASILAKHRKSYVKEKSRIIGRINFFSWLYKSNYFVFFFSVLLICLKRLDFFVSQPVRNKGKKKWKKNSQCKGNFTG